MTQVLSVIPEKKIFSSASVKKMEIRRLEQEFLMLNGSFQAPCLLKELPGSFYMLLAEYTGEHLPLMVFTNSTSFKVFVDFQIKQYGLYI